MRNLAISLIKHERIKTTRAKAKELKKFIEPLITRARKASTLEDPAQILHHKRIVMNKLRDRMSMIKLFEVLGPRYKERIGGYTRIMLLMPRLGDNSEMAFIELVEEEIEYHKDKVKSRERSKKQEKSGRPKKAKDSKTQTKTTEKKPKDIKPDQEEEKIETQEKVKEKSTKPSKAKAKEVEAKPTEETSKQKPAEDGTEPENTEETKE